MESQYVIWEGNDGPSLHGPFESEEAAISWAFDEGVGLELIDPDDHANANDWYADTPDVWVRPVLAP